MERPISERQRDERAHPRYEIIEEIGRSPVGTIFRARDKSLNRVVALKILNESFRSNNVRREFLFREAQLMATVHHPNIAAVFDLGEQHGDYFLAMELVGGETLGVLLDRQGPFPGTLVRSIAVQTCRGLSHAHEQGLVHLDIKPDNLMLTENHALKIIEFGLAKSLGEGGKESGTKGTPAYMSPEQILGRQLDSRSDIYSLGITLFECATGKLPFATGDPRQHHLHTPLPDPKKLMPALSDTMRKIILRCAQKEPEERFQSAGNIVAMLEDRA